MCHISLAQGRNASVQWYLPGSMPAILLHNPGCKSSCGTKSTQFSFLCHLYEALNTATEPIRLQGTKSLPREAPQALVSRCSLGWSRWRVSHHMQQVPIWRHWYSMLWRVLLVFLSPQGTHLWYLRCGFASCPTTVEERSSNVSSASRVLRH